MRVYWPSPIPTVNTTSPTTYIGDEIDLLTPPRARFIRFDRTGTTASSSVTLDLPADTDDAQGLMVIYRFVDIQGLTSNGFLNLGLTVSPLPGDSVSGVRAMDVSISGASPFASINSLTYSNVGTLTVYNKTGTWAPNWFAVGAVFEEDLSGVSTVNVDMNPIALSGSFTGYILDVALCRFARVWELTDGIASGNYSIDFVDPSISQLSDGGQQFATEIENRRSVSFDFRRMKEEAEMVTVTPYETGLPTLMDSIGTTVPALFVPYPADAERVFAPSMNILGHVRDWPPVVFSGANHWSCNGVVVDELL